MLKQILYTLALVVLGTAVQAQFGSVGIIGTATPGGWDEDTDMTQSDTDPNVWTASLALTTGEAKFRADDDWTVNWGATDFPMGVGVQGGDNIPVSGAMYDITFNSETGEYSFVSTSPTYASVGLIGSATPGGWDMDTDMMQDADNPNLWTLEVTLVDGEAKFRADDDWAANWGSADFPVGIGVQDGDNIPVPAGEYVITFNSASGEYSFDFPIPEYATMGVIGTATAGGWDEDTDLMQDPETFYIWTGVVTLTEGELKFRADDAWDVSWGGTDFPTGVATTDGGNIPATPGEYQVTFNHVTGEYTFTPNEVVYATVGIIGTATPGGWDMDTDMVQNPNNPYEWSVNMEFLDGEAKFRADDDWAVNWGAADFPMGTAVQDGDNIPVTAGSYNVTFNTRTGEYTFGNPLAIYTSVGIIGSGTGNGWDSDIDMIQDLAQPDQWSVEIGLTNGEMKFRADDDWAVNWGDNGFPTGTGVQDGDNIPTFEGAWTIDFNATSGDYSFTPVSIGIIGTATPGGWDEDTDMTASTTEAFTWSIDMELTDGEVKFRKDDDWAINWGEADFPVGVGVQDGPNIPMTAGSYRVTLNTLTGAYSFGEVSNTAQFVSANEVKLFPNPTTDFVTVQIDAVELQKDATVQVFDVTGKLVQSLQYQNAQQVTLDVSNLTAGTYFLRLSTDSHLIGKRFMVTN